MIVILDLLDRSFERLHNSKIWDTVECMIL